MRQPDYGYGNLTTFALPRSQILPRPLKAIFNLGNDDPDLIGHLSGDGDLVGAGLSRGEPAPILHFSICKSYEFITE